MTKKNFFLVFILIIMFIIGGGCKKMAKYHVNITITVKDADTDVAVSQASVAMDSGKIGTTDNSGTVTFLNVEGDKEYNFIVKANDYSDYQFLLQVGKENIVHTISLSKFKGSISGIIVDSKDKPVEETIVSIPNSKYNTLSNEDGSFILTDVSVSKTPYTLEIIKDGYVSRKRHNIYITTDNLNCDVGKIVLSNEPGIFTGIVEDKHTGNLLSEVTVLVEEENKTIKTNSQGYFSIEILPGSYTVIFEHPLYEKFIDHVEIKSNEETQMSIKMTPKPGSISGTVLDHKNNPLANVFINVEGTSFSAQTDTNGFFRISSLPPGQYNVHFTSTYYKTTIETFVVEKAKEITKIIKLSPKTGSIRGKVVQVVQEGTQLGIGGALIESLTTSDKTFSQPESGSFEFDSIRIGTHILEITAQGFSSVQVFAEVREGETTNISNVELSKDPGKITGTVVDDYTNKALNDVTVTLIQEPPVIVKTNESGFYSFKNLSPGFYSLRFEYANYYPFTIQDIHVEPNQTRDVGEIKLKPMPGKIHGTTTPGASVALRSSKYSYSTEANFDGIFFLEEIMPGKYTIDISLNNYNPLSIDVELTPNEIKNLGERYLTPLPGSIFGNTKFVDQVIIVQLNRTVSVKGDTFIFENVPPGNYTLNYTKQNYISQAREVEVLPNRQTIVESVVLEPETGSITGFISCSNGNITLVQTRETQYYNQPAHFKFDNILPGTYHLTLKREGYVSKFYTVTVKPGKETNIGEITTTNNLPGYGGDVRKEYSYSHSFKSGYKTTHTVHLANNRQYYPQTIKITFGLTGGPYDSSSSFRVYVDGSSSYTEIKGKWGTKVADFYVQQRITFESDSPVDGQTISFTYYLDQGRPKITLSHTWGYNLSSVRITATDTYAGIKTLGYVINNSTNRPSSGYMTISSGTTVSIPTSKGVWYIHVCAEDKAGNISYRTEGPFIIP